jgi:hypothetical protein
LRRVQPWCRRKAQEICHRARTKFAALASPAAARRWRVTKAEHSRSAPRPKKSWVALLSNLP